MVHEKTSSGLITDLYELTMAQSYREHQKTGSAVFTLYVRSLPRERNYLLCAGLETLLDYIQRFRFSSEEISYLRHLNRFSEDFLAYLEQFRFQGNLYAIPEGRIIFENEPLIQVEGSLPDLQLLETVVVNIMHHQTVIASKAARMISVSRGKDIVDFGLRRAHSPEAGFFAARASYIAGISGTSNLEAGKEFDIPVVGTMAHSYIQVFDQEEDAFKAYMKTFPVDPILLIDTFDTRACADLVIRLSESGYPIFGVRIDSGDIPSQVREIRRIFNEHNLRHIHIIVSGGVDEYDIDRWLSDGIPIDSFGVGTKLLTSADIPYLEMGYKLVEYEDQPKMKHSPGKVSFPYKRQIIRRYSGDKMIGDDVYRYDDSPAGEFLVEQVMKNGRLIRPGPSLPEIRERFRTDLERLPENVKSLEKQVYPVRMIG